MLSSAACAACLLAKGCCAFPSQVVLTGQHWPLADSDEKEKEVGGEGIIIVCLL